MAKKRKASMPMLYCIGMLVTAIGFVLPIFRKAVDAFGKTTVLFSINGFDLVGDGDSTMKIMALLIFIGAVLGVILALLPKVPQAKIIQLIAIVISVVGGLYCFFNVGDFIKDAAAKCLFAGFYMIVAGWVVALVGWILNK